ncbi:hypothetical protein LLDT2_04950 [Lactococcus lactis subsp. lactis bv. diacetylactis str. TIFN2]|nr:hypothetical protein LLDT2_04950 [Lactococcus lactis subsp. lactis bv. diacetylactis str. TIFN2]
MMLLVVLILTVEEVKITIHKVVQILLKTILFQVQVIKVKVIVDKIILILIQTQVGMVLIQIIMVLMGGELRSTNTYYKIFRLGICRWCTKIYKNV